MLYQYPLEALARHRGRGRGRQLEFARDARRIVVDNDDAIFEAHEQGLAIFSAHEDAFAAQARLLREVYGDFVELRTPRVRVIPGDPPQEPIMHVRVAARSKFAPRVRAELRARGALLIEHCTRGALEVFRAEAPLKSLLGLPARLDAITEGTAERVIRLVRYAPVVMPPQPAA